MSVITRYVTRATVAAVAATVLSFGAMAGLGVAAVANAELSTKAQRMPCDQIPGTPEAFEGKSHLQYDGQPHPAYHTTPPTSGWHYPRLMAPGVYDSPVVEELQVHFLEHGHIMIDYAPNTPRDQVKALITYARRHPRDVAVAPYPKLDHGIALTAWQRLDRLDTVDLQAVDRFVSAVSGRYDHGWQHGAGPCL